MHICKNISYNHLLTEQLFVWCCCTQKPLRATVKWVQWIFGDQQLNTPFARQSSSILSHFLYFCINETQKSSAVCHVFSLNESNMDFRFHKSIYIHRNTIHIWLHFATVPNPVPKFYTNKCSMWNSFRDIFSHLFLIKASSVSLTLINHIKIFCRKLKIISGLKKMKAFFPSKFWKLRNGVQSGCFPSILQYGRNFETS